MSESDKLRLANLAVVDDFEKVGTLPLSLEQGTNKLLVLYLNDIPRLFMVLIPIIIHLGMVFEI